MDRRTFIKKGLAGFAGAYAISGFPVLGSRWKYIVIHHSAGSFGDLAFLQKIKQKRQGRGFLKTMAYHFAIGNGNGMKVGKVVSDARWKLGLWGLHVSGRNKGVNLRGIGVCLVGNYEENQLPEAQYKALVKCCSGLMDRYNIKPQNIICHGKLTGERTLCPGKNFPYTRFYQDIVAHYKKA